jgi:ubiquinone/menaquinone biosynthesis C-methylase UbiE
MVDTNEVEAFATRLFEDLGVAITGLMAYVGDRLGLYAALAACGPATAAELAATTDTDARYLQDWLDNQAASGYVRYDAVARAYLLPDAHARVLTGRGEPAAAAGCALLVGACADAEQILDVFRSGAGIPWSHRSPAVLEGADRFSPARTSDRLTREWIPALGDVAGRLRTGGSVADVGCGRGQVAIRIAQEFPRADVVGYDVDEPSIRVAHKRASDAGVAERVRFEVASAKEYPPEDYDVVTFVDSLHDMGDPVGAVVHARRALADDGAVMLVEPVAGDRPEDNHTARGRLYYGLSVAVCLPTSRAQEVGVALGAQAGEARLREVFEQAGFGTFRRVAATATDAVFEGRVS